MMMKLPHVGVAKIAVTLVVAIGLSAPASAEILGVSASLDGAQANAGAGTGSPGTGTLVGSFDSITKQLSWDITWSGLTGVPTLMHFHGPALPNQNAGLQIGVGVAGPPVNGNAILNGSQEADLLAGLWYLNLHTSVFAGGEIRGQVSVAPSNPAPSLSPLGVAIAAIGLGLAARRWRSK
jgi:hypothetical protein